MVAFYKYFYVCGDYAWNSLGRNQTDVFCFNFSDVCMQSQTEGGTVTGAKLWIILILNYAFLLFLVGVQTNQPCKNNIKLENLTCLHVLFVNDGGNEVSIYIFTPVLADK